MSPLRTARLWFPLAGLLLGLAFIAGVACGGDDEDEGPPAATEPPGEATEAPPAASLQPQPEVVQQLDAQVTRAEGGVLEIAAEGILFVPNNLAVPLGQPVTIRVSNADPVPHTFTIANVDGQYDTEDDATTGTVDSGDSAELTLSPQIAGAYTFRCDFHPGQMGGIIQVGE